MRSQTIRQSLVIAILTTLLLITPVKVLQSQTLNFISTHQHGELLAQRSATTPAAQTEPFKADSQDEQAIRQRLQEFRQLYSPGNRKFSFDGYDLYINTDELLAYDNLAPRDTQINGWKTYKPLWDTVINESISSQQITRFDIDRVETSGDLGWSGITLRFRAKNKGKDFYGSQHLTHIWHKVNGRWRIVHEHAFAPVKVDGKEVTP